MWRELRFAARSLRKSPGFAAASVLTLAVGVGATTALFTVVYGILLRPLPYPDSSSLIRFTAERKVANNTYPANFSAAEFPEFAQRTRGFQVLAAYAGMAFGFTDAHGTSKITGAYVSPEFFRAVGRSLFAGRTIGPIDAHAPVVVISRRFWAERLGHDAQAVGKAIVLDGEPYTVIGIADDSLEIPSDKCDLWIPLGHGQDTGVPWLNNPAGGGVTIFGRLGDGVTIQQARDDARSVARAIADVYPRIAKGRHIDIVRWSDWLTGQLRPTLLILMVAGALVLILTCANLTNLQLARQVARRRETAVHVALGASRVRLVFHAIAESSLLVAAGSAIALVVARVVVRILLWMEPTDVPRLDSIRLDMPVLLFALAVATIITLLISLVPTRSVSLNSLLLQHSDATYTAGLRERRFRSSLVAAEIAVALVLLVATLLLGTSFVRLSMTDVGVKADHVMAASVDLAGQSTPTADAGRRETAQLGEILKIMSADPRIQSAAAGTSMPPSITRLRLSFHWSGAGGGAAVEKLFDAEPVSPGLFRTLGIPILRGRDFSESDHSQSTPVVILSSAAARELFDTDDVVGRQLPIPALARSQAVTIVGVVADVHYSGIDAPPAPAIYVPFAQYPLRVVYLFARTGGGAEVAAATLREAVNRVDHRIAIVSMQPLQQSVSNALAQPRFRAIVFAGIAIIALVLAAVGLSGLIAYSVSQRTAEIGIRLALGASSNDVLQMIIGEASKLSLIGIAIGVVMAMASVRLLRGFLYHVTTADPVSFVTSAIILFCVALVASYLPARRVTRIEPVRALKSE